jgi:hypothetical protein
MPINYCGAITKTKEDNFKTTDLKLSEIDAPAGNLGVRVSIEKCRISKANGYSRRNFSKYVTFRHYYRIAFFLYAS